MNPLHLRLREARERVGLSQTALAELVGVRQATISDLENGKSRRIDFDVLDAIAKALQVPPGDLWVRRRD